VNTKEANMRSVLVLLATTALVLALVVGTASGGGKTVTADNYDFKPRAVTIQKGRTVTWKNVQGVHTVTLKNGTYDKTISGDEKVSKRFKRRGTFRYICRFHKVQDMRGKVIVE
jgi:plastocyanin